MRIIALPVVAGFSPFLRRFYCHLSPSACYNPIENYFQLAAYFL